MMVLQSTHLNNIPSAQDYDPINIFAQVEPESFHYFVLICFDVSVVALIIHQLYI